MKANKWLLGLAVVPASLALAPLPLWSQTAPGQSGVRQSTPSSSAGMAASSDEIKKLQQALKDRGQDPGAINGVMTPQTQAALKAFQGTQGLSATGTLDAQSRTALGLGAGSPGASRDAGAGSGAGMSSPTPNSQTVTPEQPLPGTTSPGATGSPSSGMGAGARGGASGGASGMGGGAGAGAGAGAGGGGK